MACAFQLRTSQVLRRVLSGALVVPCGKPVAKMVLKESLRKCFWRRRCLTWTEISSQGVEPYIQHRGSVWTSGYSQRMYCTIMRLL